MLQAQQAIFRRFYFPVMPISQLQDGPKPFKLLGDPIVVWLDEEGSPAAAVDRCCHRTAKLSKGSVSEGCIVCPYHGWAFDRTGKCTWFPQSELEDPPRVYRIKGYCCKEKYGYAWVALEEPLADIPEFKRSGESGFRQVHQIYDVIRTTGLRLMENSFDNAHFAFVHRNTFGDNDDPRPPDSEIVPNETGFDMYFETKVHNKLNEKHKAINTDEQYTVRKVHSRWFMPFVRQTDITYPTGLIHSICTCATPIDDDSCMMVQFAYRNDTEQDVSAETIIAFDRAVVREDLDVLETTESNIPLDLTLRMETHMPADKPGLLMREMLLRLFREHGEREVLPQLSPPQVYKIETLESTSKA